MKTFITFVIIVIMAPYAAFSQHFTHDVGFHAGTATIQDDYGIRGNFLSSYGNSSLSFSFTHTLHFFNKNPRWNADHKIWSYIALRSELNIVTDHKLQHFGPFIVGTSPSAERFRGMTGSTQITNIGFQIEYYMRCLKDFIYPWSDIKWNPYILLGLQHTWYSNTLNSTLGDWRQDITVLPEKWRPPGAVNVGKGTTYAATFGGGVRYKFNPKIDFNLQFNWQFFFSDAVDGLQADVVENRNNEWLLNLQFGVHYHLNFDRPLSIKNLF